MQHLLSEFQQAAHIMDIKIGVRTYAENELDKPKLSAPSPRPRMPLGLPLNFAPHLSPLVPTNLRAQSRA